MIQNICGCSLVSNTSVDLQSREARRKEASESQTVRNDSLGGSCSRTSPTFTDTTGVFPSLENQTQGPFLHRSEMKRTDFVSSACVCHCIILQTCCRYLLQPGTYWEIHKDLSKIIESCNCRLKYVLVTLFISYSPRALKEAILKMYAKTPI